VCGKIRKMYVGRVLREVRSMVINFG